MLEEAGPVRLTVYNLLGRQVAVLVNQTQAAGSYAVTFDAEDLPSGMYLYRLDAAGRHAIRRMMLLK